MEINAQKQILHGDPESTTPLIPKPGCNRQRVGCIALHALAEVTGIFLLGFSFALTDVKNDGAEAAQGLFLLVGGCLTITPAALLFKKYCDQD